MTPRVAGRFELVELAARGGMGEIWRALDTVTGRQVALKRALAQGVDHDRFRREAQLLATVRHPAMVAHVAHGEDDSGVWLAMSWLEGETLAARIERRALPLTDVLQVARGLAGGLAALHHLGVVHRDVKPANIMLVDGDPARAVLLDLGIARGGASGRALTATNVLLGTLGYMAPEQAQSGRDVDARADVFALGCVLFECLTGEPAFPGDHPVAVLAQMFSRTPPRLCALRPELPPTLDALVAAMTARDPELRPRDGAAVGEALAGIGALGDVVLDSAPRRSTRITRSEQHFAVAVFAEVGGGGDVQVTVDVGIAGSRIEQLRRLVRELGSDVVVLHSTGALIALGDRGTAVDRAHLAATMARAIVEAMPDARLGISAGLVPRRGNLPAGALLERAVDMARGTDAGTIAVDPTVSELLRTRFTVQSSRERLVLGALVPTSEELRVCGHSTPFVGRDKELALLEATVSESIEECSSRAVVVLAPPGLGKSRLGRELRRRLRARGDVELFGVQAEFARAGVVNHSLRQLLRSALNVGDAPAGGLETTLRDYLRRLPGLAAPERVGDFLAALLGATPAAPGSELAASLGEPEWMARWTRRSLREWLGAASSARPIVLLFEDLHWCDDASLGHLVDALRTLRGAPVTFVAFARPEAAERLGAHPLPGLQELRLAPLGARAAERIVRAVLGDTADAARLVALAAGNPFYLEELLRFVIDALGEELPASVSALLHARIADLDPALRRFVRAASVLGERIAPAALAAVTGASDDEVGSALAALATHEMLDERDGAWWFRHALLRETAYATLDAADASAAHGLAADWLERQGDRDPREILEHLERARADERICAYCLAAASRAQEAAADWLLLELAERGLRASPSPLERGRLCALRSSALSWQDRLVESLPDGLFALQTLPHDDPLWIHTLGTFIFAAAAVGDHEALAVGVRSSLAAPRFAATRIANIALFGAVNALDVIGMRQAARELFTRAELPAPGTPAMAIRRVVEAEFAAFQDARFGSCYALAHEALAIAELHGDRALFVHATVYATGPQVWWSRCPGNVTRIEGLLREHADNPLQISVGWLELYAASARRWVLGERGPLERIRAIRDVSRAETARMFLVFADLDEGALDRAAEELERAPWATARCGPTVARARLALLRGEFERALELSTEAEAEFAVMGWPYGLEWLHLTRAEAWVGLGRRDEAVAVVRRALERVAQELSEVPEEVGRELTTYVSPLAKLYALAGSLQVPADATEEDPTPPVDEADFDIVADTPPVVGALVASPPELAPGPADMPALVELVEPTIAPSVVARGGAAHAGTSTITTPLDLSPPRNIMSTVSDRSAGKRA